jgi:3-oxoacyl-[acyl-carrier-protein] synthase II
MRDRRVVITGLGVVSPIGHNVPDYWSALCAGKSGIAPIERFDASKHSVRFAGEVREFDAGAYMDRKEARRSDRYSQYAVAASVQAIEDSGVQLDSLDPFRFGVIIGSGIGGIETFAVEYARMERRGPNGAGPLAIPMMIANMASGQIAIRFGARGINYSPVSACASGAHAVGEGRRAIQRGECDLMLVGGSEAAVTPFSIAAFAKMGALSRNNENPQHASCPFDAKRDGFVLGEGSGILVLEERQHAMERGARIYAELAGYGASADAFHITMPHPDGLAAAHGISLALSDAGLEPTEVQYVNAHGTSTPLNDKTETAAIRKVFGAHADSLMVSSNKSMTGHLLGAAGGIESVATALTLHHGLVAPTTNYVTPDPECDLDYVPHKAKEAEVQAAISNSLGFGGHNVTLAFRRHSWDD